MTTELMKNTIQADYAGGPARSEIPKPDGIRETIESIIVAFILAFVFRAFVVEAFVIPTGSMAPGLYGMHGEYRCESCGYPFAYGIRDTARLPDGRMSLGTLGIEDGFTVQCPNCGWANTDSKLNASPETKVVADSGDRILVLKWPYDIGGELLGPKRWDVVVFKDPQDGETNFIKRLLGLPGEVLEIINGDIYAAPIEDVPPDIIEALSHPPEPPPGGRPSHRRLTQAQQEELAKVLEIQRKTSVAQESLWMIHYDHDYIPDPNRQLGDRYYPRWRLSSPQNSASNTQDRSETAWDTSTPRVRFQPTDDREHWIELAGKPIQDTYGYNSVLRGNPRQSPCNVGDVRLRFVLFAQAPSDQTPLSDQQVTLLLKKGADRFLATISADGTVQLDRTGKDGIRIPLQTADIDPLQPGKPLTIEFSNVDYRVALRVDDTEVVATDDDQYKPNILSYVRGHDRDGQSIEAAIAIGAQGLPVEIRHLTVYRDVFYRSSNVNLDNASSVSPRAASYELRGAALSPQYAGYPGWGTTSNPILLRADPPDYFCCGDNSPQSKDSRLWLDVCPTLEARQGGHTYQYGTVPGDQLIGRAFFVYWPSGLRFSQETPAVIPNPGRMRIIR